MLRQADLAALRARAAGRAPTPRAVLPLAPRPVLASACGGVADLLALLEPHAWRLGGDLGEVDPDLSEAETGAARAPRLYPLDAVRAARQHPGVAGWAIDPALCPSQIPVHINPAPDLVGQDMFCDNFARAFPVAAAVLEQFGGRLFVAGGSVVATTRGLPTFGVDADFFGTEHWGADLLQETRCWLAARAAPSAKQRLQHGLLTHFEGNEKLQFVLRRNPGSIDLVLDRFDLSCCAVAYDGRQTWFTEQGAVAAVFDAAVVSPTATPDRVEKYMQRGFTPVFPAFTADEAYELIQKRPSGYGAPAFDFEAWEPHMLQCHAGDSSCACAMEFAVEVCEPLPKNSPAFPKPHLHHYDPFWSGDWFAL